MFWDTHIFNEFYRMRGEMNSLLGLANGKGISRSEFPRVNVYENQDGYALALDLPGMAKDNVDVRFGDNTVTVSGERPAPPTEAKARLLRQEREEGGFETTYRFPAKVNSGAAQAKLENGILLVRVPKAEEAKPKIIPIQS